MPESPALLLILVVSLLAQIVAAAIALRQMTSVAGRYRAAWGCVALALALMVERRLAPLWRLVVLSDSSNPADSVFGLAISLFMAAGVFGVRSLFVDLNTLASTDALTGLANRRSVLQHAQNELLRAERTKRPLSFLMFDIDYFKKVNDAHGHAAGDAVLRSIAEIARREFRRIDIVGRIGGEEFLVVLPESDLDNAVIAAERIRGAVAAQDFSADQHHIAITISVGIAVPDIASGASSVEDVLKASDEALYAAKKAGRNRVFAMDAAHRLRALSGPAAIV